MTLYSPADALDSKPLETKCGWLFQSDKRPFASIVLSNIPQSIPSVIVLSNHANLTGVYLLGALSAMGWADSGTLDL